MASAGRPRVVHRLAGVGLGVPDPATTARFLGEGLDFTIAPRGESLAVLCDGDYGDPHPQIALTLAPAPSLQLTELRLELTPSVSLDWLAEMLVSHGASDVTREAEDSVRFRDPSGTQVVCGHVSEGGDPGLVASGLRPRRLGHANLKVADPANVTRFWVRAMGMSLSEQVGDGLAFLRYGAEHHNLGLRAAGATALHHLGFEVPGWDAYRPILDHLAATGYPVEYGPGRHAVGRNMFTYIVDPSSGLRVELFCDMARIADQDDPEVAPIRWRAEDRLTRTLNVWGSAPAPASFLD